MKLPILFLALATSGAFAQASAYKNTVRQIQRDTGVIWDMNNVAAKGSGSSPLLLESGGSLFQLWTIHESTAKDHLLDQKLVGAYLPKAEVTIKTLDAYPHSVRTRVDKPFTVEFNVSDLIAPGTGIPEAATKVLVNRHVLGFPAGTKSPGVAAIAATAPVQSFYITKNGKSTYTYDASLVPTPPPSPGENTDATMANGEELFVVHILADDKIVQSQIASAKVEVFPIARGKILGIENNSVHRSALPDVQVHMIDLYPGSDTYLMLYKGSAMAGLGTMLISYPNTDNVSRTPVPLTLTGAEISAKIDEISSRTDKDGSYTLALVSNCVFDNKVDSMLIAPTVTFSIERAMELNAMQVHYSDGTDTH